MPKDNYDCTQHFLTDGLGVGLTFHNGWTECLTATVMYVSVKPFQNTHNIIKQVLEVFRTKIWLGWLISLNTSN